MQPYHTLCIGCYDATTATLDRATALKHEAQRRHRNRRRTNAAPNAATVAVEPHSAQAAEPDAATVAAAIAEPDAATAEPDADASVGALMSLAANDTSALRLLMSMQAGWH